MTLAGVAIGPALEKVLNDDKVLAEAKREGKGNRDIRDMEGVRSDDTDHVMMGVIGTVKHDHPLWQCLVHPPHV